MDFDSYQEKANVTAIYPWHANVIYPALGLTNEAGEVAGKIKKVIRDEDREFTDPKFKDDLTGELGDVLWYLAVLASDLNISLEDIAQHNLDKLASRKERGVLKGSGDNR